MGELDKMREEGEKAAAWIQRAPRWQLIVLAAIGGWLIGMGSCGLMIGGGA